MSTPDRDLCHLTATEALQRFRDRTLSPVELLDAQIARIAQVDPTLNAVRECRFDEARAQARHAEGVYARAPAAARALEGLPTALKNEHNLAGAVTDVGSRLLAGHVETENAPITQRLLDAGALIHVRTHVPEFCVAPFTRSALHGVTRNPWNTAMSAGGSSGGSGVALAAGMATLASASDIAGSARIPAAYNGVVGLKASYGRIPESTYEFAMNTYNHNSVMARSVADCALLFNVTNGPHPADPSTVKPRVQVPLQQPDVRGMRIAVSLDLGFFDVDDDIRANTLRAARHLRDQGAIVEEVDIAWDASIRTTFTVGLGFMMARGLRALVGDRRGEVSDFVLDTIDTLADFTPEQYMASQEASGRMHHALQAAVFEHYDALVCPTMASNDMPAGGSAQAHGALLTHAMTYPFNVLSRHPVLSVPTGFCARGVPTAVQIVAPTYCESDVFRIGAALEAAVGWLAWRTPA
jgi:Asp-tRNA(Asn)/Glu-tRNA(Gln) amidotransferase A subunit family amidase